MKAPALLADAPSTGSAPLLQAQGLGVARGERPLLRGLTLQLQPGELVWLRGRNGRGKTSLLRVLAGLSEPARGQVTLDSHPVRRLPAAWRTRLLYLAHGNALKEDLTVAEALRFLGRLQAETGASPGDAAIAQALTALGLDGLQHRLVRTLSQGQRRRSALARLALSLTHAPAVWLLDEPFDALDDEGVAALHRLLAAQVQRGGSVLMTSHQAPGMTQPVPRELDLDACAVQARPARAAPAAPARANA
jgi:heme exporter protein A